MKIELEKSANLLINLFLNSELVSSCLNNNVDQGGLGQPDPLVAVAASSALS